MGLDPGDDVFTPGIQCPACKDVIFGGVTPKYVLATFHDTVACPVAGGRSIDGAYLLTQEPVLVCIWFAMIPTKFQILWRVSPQSDLDVSNIVLLAGYFSDLGHPICQDKFTNTLVCGPPGIKTTGGTGIITWGPDIVLPC